MLIVNAFCYSNMCFMSILLLFVVITIRKTHNKFAQTFFRLRILNLAADLSHFTEPFLENNYILYACNRHVTPGENTCKS